MWKLGRSAVDMPSLLESVRGTVHGALRHLARYVSWHTDAVHTRDLG
jgi:hypothetical protein